MDNLNKTFYIIGAGFAGQTIADDIKRKKVFGTVGAFLDDDKNLIGTEIDGIPVLGPISNVTALLRCKKQYEKRKNISIFVKEITNCVLTNYEFRSIIKEQ